VTNILKKLYKSNNESKLYEITMTETRSKQRKDVPNLSSLDPTEIVERYEDEGFEVSIWVTNPTDDELDIRTYRDEELYIQLSNQDTPKAIELVDNFLDHLESGENFSLPDRNADDTYEIVVKPKEVDDARVVPEGKTSMRAYLTEDEVPQRVDMLEEIISEVL
jgi:hypothetical protein